MIVVLYIGVFAYWTFHGRGMADRTVQQGEQARDELRLVVGFSITDEVEKARPPQEIWSRHR